jgi:hypothetical protein
MQLLIFIISLISLCTRGDDLKVLKILKASPHASVQEIYDAVGTSVPITRIIFLKQKVEMYSQSPAWFHEMLEKVSTESQPDAPVWVIASKVFYQNPSLDNIFTVDVITNWLEYCVFPRRTWPELCQKQDTIYVLSSEQRTIMFENLFRNSVNLIEPSTSTSTEEIMETTTTTTPAPYVRRYMSYKLFLVIYTSELKNIPGCPNYWFPEWFVQPEEFFNAMWMHRNKKNFRADNTSVYGSILKTFHFSGSRLVVFGGIKNALRVWLDIAVIPMLGTGTNPNDPNEFVKRINLEFEDGTVHSMVYIPSQRVRQYLNRP